ncbi:DegV family protein [Bacillus carboniphilus]|uniref:DegV family protein n=1 Tax=Bacillus carboniphilus TaxID=86663 RepID=A0ABN0VQB1_9BACI
MTVQIIADSACDLPLSYLEEHQVDVLPLKVLLNNKEYDDLFEITYNEIYQEMREGSVPKTAQVSPYRLKEIFTKYAKQNKSAIYFAFSSGLSGTYQTAHLMNEEVKEENPEMDITVVDTKCASLGYGLVIRKAAELSSQGKTKEEIVKEVTDYSQQIEHLFTVENLEYLARGGRISKASAWIGGMLQVKPLLHVENGELVPLEKVRGKDRWKKKMVQVMKERGGDWSNQTVAISHGDAVETAEEMKQMIQSELGVQNFVIHPIGAAIGSHSGPGTIAIFFLGK